MIPDVCRKSDICLLPDGHDCACQPAKSDAAHSGLYLTCERCGVTLPHDHPGTICDDCEDDDGRG